MTSRKYKVELTEAEREHLNIVVRRGRSPARMVNRALALLRTEQGLSDQLIAEGLAISPYTVARVRKRFCEEGLESALTEHPRSGRKRKLSRRQEAHLVAIACSDPPEGHTHWTLKLLARKVAECGRDRVEHLLQAVSASSDRGRTDPETGDRSTGT